MTDNTKLFEFIYETVINEGGDGDLALVLTAQDHLVVADQFEEFLATNPFGCWQRTNRSDGSVLFWNNQESFILSNRDNFCSWSDLRGPNPVKGKEPCTSKVIVP
jgi:hypothetical protein